MVELLSVSIGIGLVISLLFVEVFGVAVGGMVVPGYVALKLDEPLQVTITVVIALLTFFIVHSLSSFIIVYGRRRTVLMILVAYILVMAAQMFGQVILPAGNAEAVVIGFIIPGLIAIWMDRQGVVETVCSLITASVAVRLILVIVLGGELQL
jgi:poly-gamma-glutamate biosynthesis protein PgsC/CapC